MILFFLYEQHLTSATIPEKQQCGVHSPCAQLQHFCTNVKSFRTALSEDMESSQLRLSYKRASVSLMGVNRRYQELARTWNNFSKFKLAIQYCAIEFNAISIHNSMHTIPCPLEVPHRRVRGTAYDIPYALRGRASVPAGATFHITCNVRCVRAAHFSRAQWYQKGACCRSQCVMLAPKSARKKRAPLVNRSNCCAPTPPPVIVERAKLDDLYLVVPTLMRSVVIASSHWGD